MLSRHTYSTDRHEIWHARCDTEKDISCLSSSKKYYSGGKEKSDRLTKSTVTGEAAGKF